MFCSLLTPRALKGLSFCTVLWVSCLVNMPQALRGLGYTEAGVYGSLGGVRKNVLTRAFAFSEFSLANILEPPGEDICSTGILALEQSEGAFVIYLFAL